MKHYWCEYWTRMTGTTHYIYVCGKSTVNQKEFWDIGDSWTDDFRKVDCPECLKIIKEKLFPECKCKELHKTIQDFIESESGQGITYFCMNCLYVDDNENCIDYRKYCTPCQFKLKEMK